MSDSASDNLSDSTARHLQPVRQPVGRSAQDVLQLIYSGVDSIADLKPEETRFIRSRSVNPDRGVVGTLVLAFTDGETWYVEVEREQA